MSTRRLLVLCYFYPPLAGGGVHRVLGFTRYLPEQGWECTVLCAGEEDYWVADESLVERVRPGTEVIRVRGGSALSAWLSARGSHRGRRPGRLFSGLRALSEWWMVPDSYAGWARRAERRAGRLLLDRASTAGPESGGFDAVLTSSPPDSVHLAGLGLKRRFGLPWVADFRDPWIGLHLRRPRSSWHRLRHTRLEREVLAGADLVLAASASHARQMTAQSEHGEPTIRQLVHLPNGYEPDPAATSRPAADRNAGSFTLVFTGMLSLMPDVEVFLEALHELFARRPEARRRLRAKLAGPYDSDYADRAIALGLTGIVEFLGPRPHAEARALQRDADLLLAWKPRNAPTMVPGKLYEYLDTGRPVLAMFDTDDEAAELVRRAGGTVVPPGDRDAMSRAIELQYAAWRDGVPRTANRPAWLEEHTRERLAARLAGLLETLAESRR